MTDTNQSAFPVVVPDCGCGDAFEKSYGITIRDYFAAKAMQGMLAYPGDFSSGSWHNNAMPGSVAAKAYEYADAMLAERGKQ